MSLIHLGQFDASSHQYSQIQKNTQSAHQKIVTSITPTDIEDMYKSREKIKDFAIKIKAGKLTPLRQDVLQYCQKVKSLKKDSISFEKVEKMMKNRIQKMIKNKRIKKNWSQQDILILIWVVSKYCDFAKIGNLEKGLTEEDWKNISSYIPATDFQSCMFKWLSLRKNRLADYSWSDKESAMLNKIVRHNTEPDWTQVSQKLYYMNNSSNRVYRCPKQCRQHWNCYLNPNLKKGPWTHQQDTVLLYQVKRKNGLKKWAEMVKLFDGRTQNALKNRYNLIIQKQKNYLPSHQLSTQLNLINNFLQRNQISSYISSQNVQLPTKNLKSMDKIPINGFCQQQSSQEIIQKRVLRKRTCKKIQALPQQLEETAKKIKPTNQGNSQKMLKQKNKVNFIQCSPAESVNQFQESLQNYQLSPINVSLNLEEDMRNNFSFLNMPPPQTPQKQFEPHEFVLRTQKNQNSLSEKLQKKNSADYFPSDIKKIKIVPLQQQDMKKFKELIQGLSDGQIKNLSFVPCKIAENKLTKITY